MFILFLIILIIIISFKYNDTPENFTGSSLEYIYDQIDPIYLETPILSLILIVSLRNIILMIMMNF